MLTESMEDYLEMIYRIVEQKGYIKAVDLAESLGVQASSITKMVQKLARKNFVQYEKYRNISLTSRGRKYGEFLIWRHRRLMEFLSLLSCLPGKNNIEEQVEGIEHYITPSTMNLIAGLITYFKQNSRAQKELKQKQTNINVPHMNELDSLRAWRFKHSE